MGNAEKAVRNYKSGQITPIKASDMAGEQLLRYFGRLGVTGGVLALSILSSVELIIVTVFLSVTTILVFAFLVFRFKAAMTDTYNEDEIQSVCEELGVPSVPTVEATNGVGGMQRFLWFSGVLVYDVRRMLSLSEAERRAVIAHEVTHTRQQSEFRAFVTAGTFTLPVAASVVSMPLAILLVFVSPIIRAQYSQRNERAADRAAAEVCGSVSAAVAMAKMADGHDPYNSDLISLWIGRILGKHPPLRDRIAALETYDTDPAEEYTTHGKTLLGETDDAEAKHQIFPPNF